MEDISQWVGIYQIEDIWRDVVWPSWKTYYLSE